jgi:two-component system cell cycle sensor histidine kinase/response regulator CckA
VKAADRAARLTRQLLAFSRQQVLDPVVLNLNAAVSDFSDMLRRVIGENIELTFSSAESLGNIRIDVGQLEQILMNLVVNARDAMSESGSIIIETANADLDETFTRQRRPAVEPGPYVMLSVSDTGCGMDSATMSKIFDPFFTTKPVGKGTGLGLPTVYGVVKQSGGHIWVYSEPLKGTTFKMYFPRVDTPDEVAPVPTADLLVAGGSETILLVEDDESLREMTSALLKNEGFNVLEAKDGSDALDIAQQYRGPIHLMLTDVIMPGMSGAELGLKFKNSRPESKVLHMSGYTANLTIHSQLMSSGILLLQKPFTKQSLLTYIRTALSQIND